MELVTVLEYGIMQSSRVAYVNSGNRGCKGSYFRFVSLMATRLSFSNKAKRRNIFAIFPTGYFGGSSFMMGFLKLANSNL